MLTSPCVGACARCSGGCPLWHCKNTPPLTKPFILARMPTRCATLCSLLRRLHKKGPTQRSHAPLQQYAVGAPMERRAGRAVQPDRMTEGPAPTQVPSPSAAPEAARASVICYNMYISQEQIVNHIVTISVITQTVITLLVDLSMNTRPLLHRLRPRQIMLLLSTEPRAQEGSTTGNFSSYPGVPAPRLLCQPPAMHGNLYMSCSSWQRART